MRAPAAQTDNDPDSRDGHGHGRRSDAVTRRPEGRDLLQDLPGLVRHAQPEELAHLAGEDDDRDPRREPHRDRERNELDEGPEPHQTRGGKHQAGQESGQDQPVQAVLGHGRGDEHDEGAGRTADLEARPAEQGHEEAADNGGVEPLCRGRARGDGDGHRERQRHDGHGQPRDGVGAQLRHAVAFAQDGHEFRGEEVGEARRAALSDGLIFHSGPHLGGCGGIVGMSSAVAVAG